MTAATVGATLAEYIQRFPQLLVLTGAGLSTASGIGDYRDLEGQYKRPPPMTIAEFLGSHAARQRYWARSMYGFPSFAQAQPNAGHYALASLSAAGFLGGGTITQNVDSLHQQAGQPELIALHGELQQVVCTACQRLLPRSELQEQLLRHNPQHCSGGVQLLPDGDAKLTQEQFTEFVVPACTACTGILRPNVVFFGDAVPKARVQACYDRVAAADALLIVGSSVMIFSSFRFVREIHNRQRPIVALNMGKTRADEWLSFKHGGPCSDALVAAAARLGVAVPQPEVG